MQLRLGLRFLGQHVGVESRGPAILDGHAPPAKRQRAVIHILCDNRPGTYERCLAYGERRHQRRIGADKGVLADHCAVFEIAVIIAEDRACADIGIGADLSIAQIGQVIGLGTPWPCAHS